MIELRTAWNACKHHWQKSWLENKHLLQNKTCLDVGIWKGVLNAKARKYLNCNTIIGIEPYLSHVKMCQKLNPGIMLYNTVDDLPHEQKVDVILLQGIICLMLYWRDDLTQLFEKVKAKTLLVRHEDYYNYQCSGEKRETNIHNLKNFTHSPTHKQLIFFLAQHNYKLITKKEDNLHFEYENI